AEISGYLESLVRTERSSLDPRQGPDGLLKLQPRRHLHPLPWPRLHGRKHARTLHRRLREILRTDRDSIRKYAARNSAVRTADSDSDSAVWGWMGRARVHS